MSLGLEALLEAVGEGRRHKVSRVAVELEVQRPQSEIVWPHITLDWFEWDAKIFGFHQCGILVSISEI
jgi:hypothetical protein